MGVFLIWIDIDTCRAPYRKLFITYTQLSIRMDKPEIYLSSPIITLEDLRSEIIHYLENEKGFKVISYGDICKGRLSGEPGKVDQCLSGVRQSNALFLVIARRYGEPKYLSNGEKVSMTELEYLEAVKHGIKRFVYCREEVWTLYHAWKVIHDINIFQDCRYDHPKKLMNFVSKIDDEDEYVDRFRDVRELKDRLSDIEFGLNVIKDKLEATGIDEKMEVSLYG